ncbi:MAG: ferredoxin family protein, partial [Haloarculaceae archaeon]
KGMNHAVTAGALAAEAFVDAKSRGRVTSAGPTYEEKLNTQGVMDKLRPTRYRVAGRLAETGPIAKVSDALAGSVVGRAGVKVASPLIERAFNSPFLLGMLPDIKTSYVTLPTTIADAVGEPISETNNIEPPELDDRIGDLTYDIDEGNPHIELQDNSFEASGTAVTACPVSAKDFGGGCYRDEYVDTNGSEEHVVSLDTQPCVECGTCAVVADTEWTHPRGGKGVEYKQG